MRLSEAIRLGAMLHPQGFVSMRTYRRADGSLWPWDLPGGGGEVVATCALGAAEMAGYPLLQCPTYLLPCPVCAVAGGAIGVITHLNDTHRWTREAIADWLEPIEVAASQPEPVSVTEVV